MSNDIILTGPPRSGTTLACFLLNKVEDTIALHEPMSLKMFPDAEAGLAAVRSFFPEMRRSLLEKGIAISKVSEGSIPANPFGDTGTTGRTSIVKKDFVHFDKPLSSDFRLIIKHNGHFTFLLPALQDYFPVYILIRNPVATIASWNSINAPVAEGNLRILQTLDPALYHSLAAIPDLITRQVHLLDKMYQAYLSATKAVFLRYEELIASSGRVLSVINPAAINLAEQLESKNTNPLYDAALIQRIKKGLLDNRGAWLDFYTENAIENY